MQRGIFYRRVILDAIDLCSWEINWNCPNVYDDTVSCFCHIGGEEKHFITIKKE